MDKETMLHFLTISGLLVIASVFTLNGPLLTFTLTLFVIAVVLNCLRIFGGAAGISDLFNFSIDKGEKLAKTKIRKGEVIDGLTKKSRGLMYLIAPSMCFVGAIFVIICFGCMWYMTLCS